MPKESLIWDVFYHNGTKYKSNKNHKNACCYAYLDVVVAKDQEAEILASAYCAVPPPVRTAKEWYELASKKVEPICRKVDTMRTHLLKKCTIIQAIKICKCAESAVPQSPAMWDQRLYIKYL
ncbi:hypothetical protein B0H13DRAFT_1908527 [Mycena leptocephala]|nr:hypothetical protein B0H13DRAFT_1918801 [Mycena leptocephala]KAJ7845187.1 hypothetical protein B0H13DRAFT_1908527 [Mycena leptocephala]